MTNTIGTLQETSLHAALKDWLAGPGDGLEVPVAGYQIDIVRDDELVEIQTANFGALRPKLKKLLPDYRVQVVYPIAREKWICRVGANQKRRSRRKSPKRGRVEHLFAELVRLPHLARHPNFSLLVVLTQEEEIWQDDGRGSWRRKGWSIGDRRLLDVVEQRLLARPADYLELLPARLPQPFNNRDLAEGLEARRRLAEQMTYCLRKMELIQRAGKRGRFTMFEVNSGDHQA
jgi:hypothetical protein